MSTRISTVLDTLRTAIKTAFPTKTEIPNAYSLTDNDEMLLENGLGIAVRSGAESANQVFNYDIESRTIGIIFTKKIFRIESDVDPIKTVEKDLLEDQVTLRKLLLKNTQLSIDSSIFKVDYVGDTGPQFIFEGDFSFLSLEINFVIDIMEEI